MASRNFTITQDGESRNFTVETGVGPRGAVGPTGPPVDIAETIHAATEKATIADADEFGQADSESGWSLKKTTWASIKATIKTYFDTIYDAIGSASSAYDSAIQRANHTGTQAQSTVLNLVSDLAGKAPTSHTHTFASLTSKPTTLAGYGITDAMPAPLELTAPPEDTSVIVSGSLTDGTDPVTFPVMRATSITVVDDIPRYGFEMGTFGSGDYYSLYYVNSTIGWSLYFSVDGADTAEWRSGPGDVSASPDDMNTLVAVSPATGSPVVDYEPGTVASQLGQLAIATIDGSRKYSFRNINLSPMTWEGATPGLLYNATLGEWRIATLTGADGSESITYGPL